MIIAGCAPVEQQISSWEVQTVESTVNCTTTKGLDDPLETTVELNTQYCFQMKGFMGVVYNDQFLRAFISKSSEDVIAMQVYNSMYTQEGRWPNPTSVSFLIGDKVKRVDAKELGSDVDCGVPGADLYGCRYENDIVFELTTEVFEEAQRLKTVGKNRFTYRINNRSTSDVDRFLHVNELLGFEEKIKIIREVM
jgi:hypothetical protein